MKWLFYFFTGIINLLIGCVASFAVVSSAVFAYHYWTPFHFISIAIIMMNTATTTMLTWKNL